MSITPPVLALGVKVPNHTFSRPSSTSGAAQGWTKSGSALTGSAVYDDSPDRGHARTQLYTLAGSGAQSGTVLSSPAPPGKLCAHVATYITGFALIKTTGLSATSTFKLNILWYNSSGSQVGTTQTLFTRTSNSTDWTVIQSTVLTSTNPASAADHFRLQLAFDRSSGSTAITVQIAFACVGTYTTAAGYYTATNNLSIGSGIARSTVRNVQVDPSGVMHSVDRDRWVQGHSVRLYWDFVTDTERKVFDYLTRMSVGRVWDNSAQNPNGGNWPLIVVPNLTGMPLVFMGELAGEEFPTELAQSWWADPPNWRIALALREVV